MDRARSTSMGIGSGLLLASALAWALALSACMGAQAARAELDQETYFYNRDLRWSRCAQAAVRIDGDLADRFLETCTNIEGKLHIEDINIIEVKLSEDHQQATLRVRYTYISAPSVTLKTQMVEQLWSRSDGRWKLADGAWPVPGQFE